jgi:hypothetical protein
MDKTCVKKILIPIFCIWHDFQQIPLNYFNINDYLFRLASLKDV